MEAEGSLADDRVLDEAWPRARDPLAVSLASGGQGDKVTAAVGGVALAGY